MKKFFVMLIILLPLFVSAALGPGVSQVNGQDLKWEEGAWDYFVMFKSLITQVTGQATTGPENPQADTCIDYNVGSTFTLTSKHVPTDTYVDRAFLIWMAGQDPSKMNGPTDNSVTLTFSNSSMPELVSLSTEVVSPIAGFMNPPAPMFEYEATTKVGSAGQGVFTYRVDVTDFMHQIIELGAMNGITNTGEALYGNYNVKGMECSNASEYITTSGMVGAWALVFVYTSERISPKKIYFYNGLEAYRFQEAFLDIHGFELPHEAEVRLTFMVAEGDPGLASAVGTDFFQPAPPEALAIKGQNYHEFALLFNECNPPKTTPLHYTEVYNSNSSIYGWDDEFPTCIGGDPNFPDPNQLEYGIDVDTFLLKAKDFPFDQHLKKGDTMFSLKIGANQDQVYTNLLVLSVDTKAPKFDIPANPDTPDGREKSYCSCSTEADAVCFDRPFYYLIKVQNWGENLAENVTVQDTLPPNVEYEKGTTEIATVFEDGVGTDWTSVPDVNGDFPFATAQKVADLMGYCDKATFECPDTVMIRFVVKPKSDLPKHETIKNSATIKDSGGIPYNTNSNIALRLKNGQCPPVTECNLPPKPQCGGVFKDNPNYCDSDKDCKDGKQCIDHECKDAPKDKTKDAAITFGEGLNSPDSSTVTIISSPKKNLVAGQFYLMSEGDTGKSFDFGGITVKFYVTDSDVQVSNIRLFADEKGSGTYSEGLPELAKVDVLSGAGYAEFNIIELEKRAVPSGIKNNFIIVVDALTTATEGRAGSFYAEIENKESIRVSDSGNPTVKGDKIEFATFRFEPPDGFIFTKGANDPQVPTFKDMNKDNPVLQIRTKSMDGNNAIKSIRIKAPSRYARFGEGIEGIALILDENGNGEHDPGEPIIGKVTQFEDPLSVRFTSLEGLLSYNKGEEKHLLIKCKFNMKEGDKAKLVIDKNQVVLSETKEIAELPVSSKEFKYECDPNDPNSCEKADPKEPGCSVTSVDTNSGSLIASLIAVFAALFLAFRLRKI
ncbi:MAG: hypothetical protein ACOX2F_11145 [bacterium]